MKPLTAETKAAYEKATAAIREFAEVFRRDQDAPDESELELIAEEHRDFARDLYNGYFAGDDQILLDVYDMRLVDEEEAADAEGK